MNKHFISGRLGKEPDMSYTPSGLAVSKFSVCSTHSKKSEKGEWEKIPTWHNVVVFGSTAENCSKYLRKGDKVSLVGRASNRNYTGKDGVERTWHEVVVEEIDFPSKSNSSHEETPPDDDGDWGEHPF